MAVRFNTNIKQWQVLPKAYSANFSLTGNDSEQASTNLGATGNITGTLPQALPGREYYFFVASGHTLTVSPRSTDSIRGKGAGATYAYGTIGGLLKLVCIVQGTWEIEVNIGPFA
jgi:hypothetical protein